MANIHKKSRIPALASLSQVVQESAGSASKKKIFDAREKLRAGMHDPIGAC